MRTAIDDHVGMFEWNTDDWDSVDWCMKWDRQIATARSMRAARAALLSGSAGPSHTHPLITNAGRLFQREAISDTVERLTTPILDNSIPWIPDRFAPYDSNPSIADAPAERWVWCQPGAHYWRRPVVAGSVPTACPEHSAASDASHPSSDPSCFRFDDGWGLRVPVVAHLRWATEIDMPESLAAAIGIAPQSIVDVPSSDGRGPVLRLWRGWHSGSIRGDIDSVLPADVSAEDLLFIAFSHLRYSVHLTSPRKHIDLTGLVEALVGLPDGSANEPNFWERVARRLGVSAHPARRLVDVALARGDAQLATAIDEAVRYSLEPSGWGDAWDLTASLHGDERFLALTVKGRTRVAVGVADPNDRLPDQFLVTPGGLVWVEVDDPEEAVAARSVLELDVTAPALSERWVAWMRLEHAARLASLAGVAWRVAADGTDGWHLDGGRQIGDLAQALADIGEDQIDAVREGHHQRHLVPRTVLAVDRALRRARAGTLEAIASDRDSGFVAQWATRETRASTVLGVLALA